MSADKVVEWLEQRTTQLSEQFDRRYSDDVRKSGALRRGYHFNHVIPVDRNSVVDAPTAPSTPPTAQEEERSAV